MTLSDTYIFIPICVIVGILIVFQAALQATLGRLSNLNSYSALMTFVIGFPVVLIYYLVESKGGKVGNYTDPPWWSYLGGALGVSYIITIIFATRALGTATVLATLVASQVATSILVDHFGIVGIEKRNASIGRIIGGLLSITGAVLIAIF